MTSPITWIEPKPRAHRAGMIIKSILVLSLMIAVLLSAMMLQMGLGLLLFIAGSTELTRLYLELFRGIQIGADGERLYLRDDTGHVASALPEEAARNDRWLAVGKLVTQTHTIKAPTFPEAPFTQHIAPQLEWVKRNHLLVYHLHRMAVTRYLVRKKHRAIPAGLAMIVGVILVTVPIIAIFTKPI